MPSNNPVSKKEEARVVKHPGKRDRDVCATPKKEEPVLKAVVVEPKMTVRKGMDNIWRMWDKNGHLIAWSDTELKMELVEDKS